MISCGIDEVGYGPRLGPLILCAAFLRGERVPRNCPVPVADSKKIYVSGRSIETLERTALAFAGQVVSLEGITYQRLRAAAGAPCSEDFPLPWVAGDIPVSQVRQWLRGRAFGFAARVVEPEGVNRSKNKATLLFQENAKLVRSVLKRYPGEPVRFRIGKHGGRRFYLPLLFSAFGVPFWVEREERARSTYVTKLEDRKVTFDFLQDGEDRDFLLALASMLGKYLREGAMRLFNEFWRRHVQDLRPTAGYGTDGARFFREIEPTLRRMNISPTLVIRQR